MDSTASISKGCFTFVPPKRKKRKVENNSAVILTQPWYRAYKKIWTGLNDKIQELNQDISASLVNDVVEYVAKRDFEDDHIQTAVLFTGINLPDHDALFDTLRSNLENRLGCHVAMLSSHSVTVKSIIENMVTDFMRPHNSNVPSDSLNDSDEQSASDCCKIKKSDCTMSHLLDWYNQLKPSVPYKCCIKLKDGDVKHPNKPPLVIIMRDLEAYDSQVLQRFLSILSVYTAEIPIVIVFGVATTLSMIHSSLSHCMVSKLAIRIFQSQPSVVFLNSVLEKVFLTPECPFQLGGKVFQYLTDTFLFYDFSVSAFIKGIQFTLMDHFYYSNLAILCTRFSYLSDKVKQLNENQIHDIFELPSMTAYSEIHLMNDSDRTKNEIMKLLNDFHTHVARFHMAIRCLHSLVKDLPQSPLGKHVREIYVKAMQMNIVDTAEFKDCFHLLTFLSKDDLLEHINIMTTLLYEISSDETISGILKVLTDYKEKVRLSGSNTVVPTKPTDTWDVDLQVKKRSQLKQKLFDNINRDNCLNEYEKLRLELIEYLTGDLFKPFLMLPTNLPLHEIFVYDNISAIRAHTDGKPRPAIQSALQDPHKFLQCDCCKSTDRNQILKSMPDTCIAYKLHLECGALINLYDWLQSFAALVDAGTGDDSNENVTDTNYIGSEIQARFWQSVSELQLMGFIQPSKRKVDHVERLTFDGN